MSLFKKVKVVSSNSLNRAFSHMMGDGLPHRVPKWVTSARLTRELGLLARKG